MEAADLQFLERTGLQDDFALVIGQLMEHQPSNPLQFINEFFDERTHGVSAVTKVYRQLKRSKYNQPRYIDLVWDSYEEMGAPNAAGAGGDNFGIHVDGADYMQLLGMLCSDYSPQAADVLLRKFERGDSEGVSFKFFLTGILVCCMYQEFINDAEQVFLSLKTDLTGSADHAACEAVLRALAASVRRTSKFTLLGTEHAAVAWPCVDREAQALQVALGRMADEQHQGEAAQGSSWNHTAVKLPIFLRSASSLFLRLLH